MKRTPANKGARLFIGLTNTLYGLLIWACIFVLASEPKDDTSTTAYYVVKGAAVAIILLSAYIDRKRTERRNKKNGKYGKGKRVD